MMLHQRGEDPQSRLTQARGLKPDRLCNRPVSIGRASRRNADLNTLNYKGYNREGYYSRLKFIIDAFAHNVLWIWG